MPRQPIARPARDNPHSGISMYQRTSYFVDCPVSTDSYHHVRFFFRSFGSYPHADGIQVFPIRAGEELARDLEIEPGDDVICIKKRILADTTPVIYSIDYLPRALFGARDYTRIDLTGGVFDILERECHQQISSNVAHLKASCGDDAIRSAMRLAPGEAMLLLDEVCFNRLCRPVMRSLSYYTNFFDFSILRKLL